MSTETDGSTTRDAEAHAADGSGFLGVMRDESARGAELRSDWRGSPERRRIHSAVAVIAVGVAVAAAAGWLIGSASSHESTEPNRALIFGVGALGLGCYIGALLLFLYRGQQRRAWYDRVVVISAGAAVNEAEVEASEEGLDLVSLWKLTQKRLDYYHKIATNQAEKSFAYGVTAAAIGFLVLVGTGISVSLSNSTTAAVASGIVGVTGSALAAYIGATFLRLQESSAVQLRAYFAQPLEFSRFLAAERLLGSLDSQTRESATRDLICALASQQLKSRLEHGDRAEATTAPRDYRRDPELPGFGLKS